MNTIETEPKSRVSGDSNIINARARYQSDYLESVIGIPFTTGNSIEVLKNGREIFPSMLAAIGRAKRSILFETYVYWKGDIAKKFSAALAGKAKEGVITRVLLDAHGANPMRRELLEEMKSAGVQVEWFRPLKSRPWDFDKRTHRKILVCDGEVGFTGGVGIAEEWEGNARNKNEWRETHFRIEGPAVAALCGAFWNTWIDIDHRKLPRQIETVEKKARGDVRAMVVRSSPATHQSEMELVFESLITIAQEKLTITTPYFNIRPQTIQLLKKRAEEGIVIEFLLPDKHIDKKFELAVAEDSIEPLVHSGITFRRFKPTMIHTKVIRVDDTISCVGSPNFNQRSRKKDFEIAMIIDSQEIAAELDGHYQHDISRAFEIDPDTVKKPSLLRRLQRWALRPFKEQL